MSSVGSVRDRPTFRALHATGRRRRSGPLTVTVLLEPQSSRPRVAYAIGRHVGPAVTRNRIRRRLRAIVRDSALAPGAYLVSAGPGAATTGYDELAQHLRTAVAP